MPLTADEIRAEPRATVHLLAHVFGIRIADQQGVDYWFSTTDLSGPKWGLPGTALPRTGLEIGRAATASFVAGTRIGGGLASIDDVELRVVNQRLRDGTYTLDEFEGIEFSGRDTTIYWLGEMPDGRVLTYANREVWFDGIIGQGSKWTPDVLTLPVMARAPRLDAEIIGGYRGTPYAIAFDGVNDEVSLGDILNPTASSFSRMVTFWAEAPPASGAVTVRLIDKSKWWLEYDATTAASPVLRWHVEVGGTTLAPTVAIPAYHRFYTVVCSYDKATGIARIRHDGSGTAGEATKAGGGNPDVDASTLYFGRQSSAAAKFYDGVMGEWAFFSAALTPAEELDYMSRALRGDEANLLARWTGVVAAGKLVDTGPSYNPDTGTSVNDGTVTGPVAAALFEGGPEMAGRPKRLLLGSELNVRGVAVYPNADLKLYQFSAGATQLPSAVRDAGGAVTFDVFQQRIYPFFGTAPGAAKYTFFPYLGTARLDSKTSFGDVTADLAGLAVQDAVFTDATGAMRGKPARGLFFDGVDDSVSFGATPGASFGNPFTFEVFGFIADGQGGLVSTILESGIGSGDIRLSYHPAAGRLRAGWVIPATLELFEAEMPISPGPFRVSFVVDLDAAVRLRLYLDGSLRQSRSVGATLATGGTLIAGKDWTAAQDYLKGTISEIRFWTSARTAEEIRANLYVDTPATTPAHWWKPPLTTSPTTWVDSGSIGGATGTITGATWGPGIPWSTTRELTRRGLLAAAVDSTAIDFAEAWGIAPDALGSIGEGAPPRADGSASPPPGEPANPNGNGVAARAGGTIRGLLSELLNSLNCGLVYDRSATTPGRWILRQVVDPEDAASTLTIDQVDSLGQDGGESKPPQLVGVGYGPVDLVQVDGDLIGTVDAALRQLVGSALRFVEKRIEDGEILYPLSITPIRIPARLRDLSAAQAELARQVELIGVRRRVWALRLTGGPWEHVTPGQVVTVEHPRVPGGSAKFLVLKVTDPGLRSAPAVLYGWR